MQRMTTTESSSAREIDGTEVFDCIHINLIVAPLPR